MTATPALTSAPTNALRFWSSGRDIFVEIPATNPGLPATTIRFPYGPAGLAKALDLIGAQRYDYAGTPLIGPWTNPCPKNPLLHSILQRRGMIP